MVKTRQLGIKRKTQKRVIKKFEEIFPLASTPLKGRKGERLTNI